MQSGRQIRNYLKEDETARLQKLTSLQSDQFGFFLAFSLFTENLTADCVECYDQRKALRFVFLRREICCCSWQVNK